MLGIVSRTLPRGALALTEVDLVALAREVRVPVLRLVGELSPPWSSSITRTLAGALPVARVSTLSGHRHEAIDTAPETVLRLLERLLERFLLP